MELYITVVCYYYRTRDQPTKAIGNLNIIFFESNYESIWEPFLPKNLCYKWVTDKDNTL